MKLSSQNSFRLLEPREPLKLEELNQSVRDDALSLRLWLDRMSQNHALRDEKRPGKSGDGRKRSRAMGKDATPWEGARDQDTHAIEGVIAESKLVMTSAQRAAKLEVKGTNSGQDASAAVVTPVMNHVLHSMMGREVVDEPELAADYMLEHGIGFLGVDWKVERSFEDAEISIDDLLAMALQMRGVPSHEDPAEPTGDAMDMPMESGAEQAMDVQQVQFEEEENLWGLLLDPERKEELVAMIKAYDPAMADDEARRVATQLKKGESAVYFRPYVRESRPVWEAQCLGVDVTMSASCLRDVQQAPRVTFWKWFTEAQLRDIGLAEGWEELDTVAANPGLIWADWGGAGLPSWVLGTLGVGLTWANEDIRKARLYHVAITFHRMPTKAGPSVLYRTVHHGSVKDKPLKHEVYGAKHGKIPLIPLRFRTRSKLLIESPGVPQEAADWQDTLKLHSDAQDDATVLRTTPPVMVPAGRFGTGGQLPFGPWSQVQIDQRTGNQPFGFIELPGSVNESLALKAAAQAEMCRFFGLPHKDVPPALTQMHQQRLAAIMTHALNEALEMTFQLWQQYGDPIVNVQVSGMATPLSASPEEIRGQFKFQLSFDVRELDMEFLAKKFDLLSKMLQFDSGGFVKRGALMQYVFAAADPVLAQRLVIDDASASDASKQDEQQVIASIVAGNKVRGRLESPRSRLDAHEEWWQNPQTAPRCAQDQMLLMSEIERVKTLEFQLEQQTTNKQTGRTGEPAQAPWEYGQKLSERLEVMFGLSQPDVQTPVNVVPMNDAA